MSARQIALAIFGNPVAAATGPADAGPAVFLAGGQGDDAAGRAARLRPAVGPLLVEGVDLVVEPAVGASAAYSVPLAQGRLCFADGGVLELLPYGIGTIVSFQAPTVLRICAEEDFSAFLRDADRAWEDGRFADAVTDPEVWLADRRPLGAFHAPDGPRVRLFCRADGLVSTGPSGAVIGSVDEPVPVLARRWAAADATAALPGGQELAAALREDERSEALRERPWLGRYHEVVDILRQVRSEGETPLTVVGFGAGQAAGETGREIRVLTESGVISRGLARDRDR